MGFEGVFIEVVNGCYALLEPCEMWCSRVGLSGETWITNRQTIGV
ncbi:hypothetical protein HanXRQr2_Chr14g0668821 [Helianthus annuus]|uniref:Uncharacterized protein n=1 Tax=Helianthus annuus TaxID=4232 RepID=A0A9K3EER7_HELAN|nr:hypothetical protein HanXRQr2_Chr14g0668821 [Helianthus annuus]